LSPALLWARFETKISRRKQREIALKPQYNDQKFDVRIKKTPGLFREGKNEH
jgi:hypothetical protein